MKKVIKILIAFTILLMPSVKGLSQDGQKNGGIVSTWQNERLSVALVKGLKACDVIRQDNQILANTIDSQYLMLDLAKDRIEDCIREVEKRDYIIERKDSEYKSLEELNESLRQDLRKERRRGVWKNVKTVGAFILGGAVGYFGADVIK